MALALGAMLLKLKGSGIGPTAAQLGKFQNQFKGMAKEMQPALQKLQKEWKKFALLGGTAFALLIRASPRLRAEMDILNIRIQQLVRPIGDALAPAIRVLSDLVKGLTEWFKGLPKPIQDFITLATLLTVTITVLGGAIGALSALLSPVTLVVLGIAAALALLFVAFQENWFGIRDLLSSVINAIIGVLNPLFEILGLFSPLLELIFGVAGTIFEGIGVYITSFLGGVVEGVNNFLGIFEGILNIIAGLFTGDPFQILAGVATLLTSIVGLFTNITTFLTKPFLDFVDFLTGGFLSQVYSAGQTLIAKFFEGAQAAISEAGEVVNDVLSWLGSFFGGSLPERGPLKHIVSYGKDLGAAYVTGLGTGIEKTRMGDVIDRSININRLEVAMQPTSNAQGMFMELTSDIRRSTSW